MRPVERKSVVETGLGTLRSATNRSLSTIAGPFSAVIGRSKGGSGLASGAEPTQGRDEGSQAGPSHGPSRYGALVIVGLGVAGIAHYRKPLRNDSESAYAPKPVSVQVKPETRVAVSPSATAHAPMRIFHVYILEPILTFFRFLHLALLFGPVIITAPMIFIGTPPRVRPGRPVHAGEESWEAVWWYSFLVKQMERAGPSFIKLGQWAASRADLFPASLCDKMSKLHSNGHPHSLRHTKREVERTFGMKFEDIFEEFGETPIGCGAIAQVSYGRMRGEAHLTDDCRCIKLNSSLKYLVSCLPRRKLLLANP
jgi:aarF domain-containing kinase